MNWKTKVSPCESVLVVGIKRFVTKKFPVIRDYPVKWLTALHNAEGLDSFHGLPTHWCMSHGGIANRHRRECGNILTVTVCLSS